MTRNLRTKNMMVSKEQILSILQQVKDPEIPTTSIVELGIVDSILIDEEKISIGIIPTFAGCPAVDYMKQDILTELQKNGILNAEITVLFSKMWTSDLVSESGKRNIEKHGLAFQEHVDSVSCPVCHSSKTILKSPFGPTLCRSVYKCLTCHETFEAFKQI